jgi:hypothetical protein
MNWLPGRLPVSVLHVIIIILTRIFVCLCDEVVMCRFTRRQHRSAFHYVFGWWHRVVFFTFYPEDWGSANPKPLVSTHRSTQHRIFTAFEVLGYVTCTEQFSVRLQDIVIKGVLQFWTACWMVHAARRVNSTFLFVRVSSNFTLHFVFIASIVKK